MTDTKSKTRTDVPITEDKDQGMLDSAKDYISEKWEETKDTLRLSPKDVPRDTRPPGGDDFPTSRTRPTEVQKPKNEIGGRIEETGRSIKSGPTLTERAGAAVDTAKEKTGEAWDATKQTTKDALNRANQSEREFKGKVGQTLEDTGKRLKSDKTILDKAEDAWETTKDKAAKTWEGTKEKVEETLSPKGEKRLADKAKDQWEKAKQKGDEWGREAKYKERELQDKFGDRLERTGRNMRYERLPEDRSRERDFDRYGERWPLSSKARDSWERTKEKGRDYEDRFGERLEETGRAIRPRDYGRRDLPSEWFRDERDWGNKWDYNRGDWGYNRDLNRDDYWRQRAPSMYDPKWETRFRENPHYWQQRGDPSYRGYESRRDWGRDDSEFKTFGDKAKETWEQAKEKAYDAWLNMKNKSRDFGEKIGEDLERTGRDLRDRDRDRDQRSWGDSSEDAYWLRDREGPREYFGDERWNRDQGRKFDRNNRYWYDPTSGRRWYGERFDDQYGKRPLQEKVRDTWDQAKEKTGETIENLGNRMKPRSRDYDRQRRDWYPENYRPERFNDQFWNKASGDYDERYGRRYPGERFDRDRYGYDSREDEEGWGDTWETAKEKATEWWEDAKETLSHVFHRDDDEVNEKYRDNERYMEDPKYRPTSISGTWTNPDRDRDTREFLAGAQRNSAKIGETGRIIRGKELV